MKGTFKSIQITIKDILGNHPSLQGIARTYNNMKGREVIMVIAEEDFKHYWRRGKEQTSSSLYEIHFGRYKATTFFNVMSKIHSFKLLLIIKSGLPHRGGPEDCR